MTELATPGQLRMSYWRWAMVTVPAIVLIGSLSGLLSNSGYGNRWKARLGRLRRAKLRQYTGDGPIWQAAQYATGITTGRW